MMKADGAKDNEGHMKTNLDQRVDLALAISLALLAFSVLLSLTMFTLHPMSAWQ